MTGLLDRPNATTDTDVSTDPGDGDAATDAGTGLEAIAGRPVVTLGGDDAAGIHDVVRADDEVVGFTLEKRTLFGGRLDATLPLDHVLAIGPDAVIVVDEQAFVRDDDEEPLTPDLRVGDAEVADEEPLAAAAPATFGGVRTLPVVAADDGEAVGRVDRFVIDPVTRHVGSIRLDHVVSDVRFLSWREVTSFDDEQVTISTAGVLRKPDGPREDGCRHDYRPVGKPVVTDDGRELGTVEDVEFDREDGRVTALLLEGGDRVGGHRIRGLGPYAFVVTA